MPARASSLFMFYFLLNIVHATLVKISKRNSRNRRGKYIKKLKAKSPERKNKMI